MVTCPGTWNKREREGERYRTESVRYGGTGQDGSRSSVPVNGNNGFPRSKAQRDSSERECEE